LINKPEIDLSENDKNELLWLGLELAEFIYTLAKSRFASDNKGELAIFRKSTDVRPLTSEVMQELAQGDAQAKKPNIPTV
jgi:hypothetical protein